VTLAGNTPATLQLTAQYFNRVTASLLCLIQSVLNAILRNYIT